jgi:DNA-directed RNA polymerase subunit RPC12/RpoP
MTLTPALSQGRGGPQESRPENEFIKTFPCQGCGAKLSFAPGTLNLKCEYCGAENEIEKDDARIEELPFEAFLKALEGREESMVAETVKCAKCGAEQSLPADHFAAHCSFCRAPIVSKGYASRILKPRGMIPFQVDRARAQDEFRRWVRGLWFAPGDLKRYVQSDAGLDGVYLPYWTYDCRTASDYRGERGEHYYVDETYTTTDSKGESVTRTRRVQHTRWSPASGHVEKFHDDVLVMASKTLPPEVLGASARWNLKGLVAYQAEYVSGFRAEAYQVGLREGFPIARRTIDAHVRELVAKDIGGDVQRIHHLATRYDDVRFKHVLLPVWISAYRYRDRVYRFLVNGQTGEVSGESPKSWWKIAFLVLGILLVLFLVLAIGAK